MFLFRQSTYGNAVIFCSSACSLCSFPVLLACSLHIQRLCGNLQVWKWSDGWDRRDSMLHFVSDSSWWTYRALWLSILSVAEVKSFPPYMHQLHSLSTYVCMMMSGWREMWLHVTVESSQEIASWHLRKQNILFCFLNKTKLIPSGLRIPQPEISQLETPQSADKWTDNLTFTSSRILSSVTEAVLWASSCQRTFSLLFF